MTVKSILFVYIRDIQTLAHIRTKKYANNTKIHKRQE